jgi:hypothetical protein
MPKENYSEKEAARIFKRAAELESKQSQDFDAVEGAPGLSLDELSQIAVDAGLDPNNVRKAAEELSPSGQPQTDNQTASVKESEVIVEQWVEGEFTDDLADLVIADLNHRYNASHEKVNWMDNIMNDASLETDQQSSVKRTGKSVEWSKLNKHGTDEVRVLIQPRNEKIRIRVAKKNAYGTTFEDTDNITGFLPYIPYLAGIIMLFAPPFGFFFNINLAIPTFILLWVLISKNKERIRKKFADSKASTLEKYRTEVESVARNLAGLIGQPQKESKTEPASEKEDPTVSLDDIELNDTNDEADQESDQIKSRNRDRSDN